MFLYNKEMESNHANNDGVGWGKMKAMFISSLQCTDVLVPKLYSTCSRWFENKSLSLGKGSVHNPKY